ncbi:MAG: ABC transporter ATP-binding protein [Gemmatimonadota bacterium]|nr:ABC transporter ATP-binding protein [Gemmatimonadota bacterium]
MRFADGTLAVSDLDLNIDDGELLAVVGPSGCGKSTVLRILAGLEVPTEGEVKIDGRVVTEVPPGDRDLAIVFQDYALYPHLSAYQNMAFALKAKRMGRKAIDLRVREVAALLGLEPLLHRRPSALSGGERQRVAMGRAIVRHPSAFLMDEPLSNLDAKLRVQLRSEIRRLHRELGATFLYVTHDQTEALTIGDRVAVLRKGRLQQLNSPHRLYEAPANVFVAGFIGTPPMNLLRATVEVDGERQVARAGPWSVPVPPGVTSREILVGIRPEHLGVPPFVAGFGHSSTVEVTVTEVETMGAVSLLHFAVDAQSVSVRDEDGSDDAFTWGEPPATVIAAVDARTRATPGCRLPIALDRSRVRFFDADTGQAVASTPSGEHDPLGECSLSQEEHHDAGEQREK